MQLKNIPNKYLFILMLMFLCQGVIILVNWLLHDSYNYENTFWFKFTVYFVYLLIIMIPFYILLNIYALSVLFENKSDKILNIIATICAICLYCIFSPLQSDIMPVCKAPKYTPYSQENYKTEVLKHYKYMKPTYFPDEIPQNSKNYCCFSYEGFNFLRFNTDNKYLNDTIAKNKNKIDKIMSLSEFEANYPDVYFIFKPYVSIKDSDKYKIYLFKQSLYKNFDYYGGFITLMETGEIIFFNLEINIYNNENDRFDLGLMKLLT